MRIDDSRSRSTYLRSRQFRYGSMSPAPRVQAATDQDQFVVQPTLHQHVRMIRLDLGQRQVGKPGRQAGVDAAAVAHAAVDAIVRVGVREGQQQVRQQVFADRLGHRQAQAIAAEPAAGAARRATPPGGP
jgi:hypothetical protein